MSLQNNVEFWENEIRKCVARIDAAVNKKAADPSLESVYNTVIEVEKRSIKYFKEFLESSKWLMQVQEEIRQSQQ